MAEKIRHDQLFKLVVGKKEAAKEVLQLTLPTTIVQELDLESLELQNDKYVDEMSMNFFNQKFTKRND